MDRSNRAERQASASKKSPSDRASKSPSTKTASQRQKPYASLPAASSPLTKQGIANISPRQTEHFEKHEKHEDEPQNQREARESDSLKRTDNVEAAASPLPKEIPGAEVLHEQSVVVQKLNTQLDSNIVALNRMQDYQENYDHDYEQSKHVDGHRLLARAHKQIKIIKHECNTVMASEDQRHVRLSVPGLLQKAAPGEETVVDILENCHLSCKVEVYARRMPLKIHINYAHNQKGMPE